MPKEEISIQDLDEKTSQPMDFNRVIMEQVNRINYARTLGTDAFPRSVEALMSCLAFHRKDDNIYKKEMAEIDTEVEEKKKEYETANPARKMTPQQAEELGWARATLKFDTCIRLMGRAGFFPQRQVDFVE